MDEEEIKKHFPNTSKVCELFKDILAEYECSLYEVRSIGMYLIEVSIREAIRLGLPLEKAKNITVGMEDKIYERALGNLNKGLEN